MKLRRTRLYVPGNSPDLQVNCGLFGADCIILDLEDSVGPADKDAARILVREALGAVDFGGAERIVRINALSTPYGLEDLEAMVPQRPDTILLPKCGVAEDVAAADRVISELEAAHGLEPGSVRLMPLIETALGVINAYPIATASRRVTALNFGAEDFTADLAVARTREGKEHLFARCQIVLAARAAGIQALDTVYSDVDDTEGLIASTRESKALGFEGRGIIHPAQIDPVHQVFTPSEGEISYALRVRHALQEAQARGTGVASVGSKMVDAPIAARAEKVLALAQALGLLKEVTP